MEEISSAEHKTAEELTKVFDEKIRGLQDANDKDI